MKKVLTVILFVIIGLFLSYKIADVLSSPIGVEFAMQTGMKDVHKYKNQYDVLILGTSIVATNVSNQYLYEEYGIAGISIGEPMQQVYLSKYTLEDALQHQSPEVVMFDSRALFYTQKDAEYRALNEADVYVHPSIDSIQSLEIKKEAIEYIRRYDSEIDPWEYYSRFYKFHTNWKKLTQLNFESVKAEKCMHGNVAFTFVNQDSELLSQNINGIPAKIDSEMERNFAEMVQLSKASGSNFLLVTSYLTSPVISDMLAQLAEKYDVPYLDINENLEAVQLNSNTDYNDYSHFNLNGAIKWTHFLGEFLSANYTFSDKRMEVEYKRYEDNRQILAEKKQEMNERINIYSAITFHEYLSALQNLDYSKYMVFISVYDDATAQLSETGIGLLRDLGLKTDLRGQFQASYVAVISEDAIEEKFDVEETVTIEGENEGVSYSISSGGYKSGLRASIKIDDIEYIQKYRGFVIVVYDLEEKEVIDSVFFDTCEVSNPHANKYRDDDSLVRMVKIGANQWKDFD